MFDILQLTYGAKIEKDGDGYLVTFRDIDNAFTQGETYQEALQNAQEVLDLMLLDRVEHNDAIPILSLLEKGEIPITASPEVAIPALFSLLLKFLDKTNISSVNSIKNLSINQLKQAASELDSIVEIRIRKSSHSPLNLL